MVCTEIPRANAPPPTAIWEVVTARDPEAASRSAEVVWPNGLIFNANAGAGGEPPMPATLRQAVNRVRQIRASVQDELLG